MGPAKFGIISVFWASILVTARFLTTGIKDGATRYIAHYEAVNDKDGMTKTFLAHLKFMILITLFFLFISLLLFRIITDNLFFGYVSLYIFFITSCILYFSLLFLRGTLQGLRELKDNLVSIIVSLTIGQDSVFPDVTLHGLLPALKVYEKRTNHRLVYCIWFSFLFYSFSFLWVLFSGWNLRSSERVL